MDIGEAEHLVALARERGLQIASAPSSVLGEAAQTARRAIEDGTVGDVRLAYAEMEDSMVFRENYRSWRSLSGAPWPAEDEFAVGCTLEHAGYYLTWLCEFFGPVEEMTAFSAKLFPDKGTDQAPEAIANDFFRRLPALFAAARWRASPAGSRPPATALCTSSAPKGSCR